MSSNILKGNYVVVAPQDKVVIDNNDAVARLLEELSRQVQEEAEPDEAEEGFVEGLDASLVAQLVMDEPEISQEELEKQKDEILKEAREEAESIRKEAEMLVEEMKAEARENGYREGYESGRAAAEEELCNHYELKEQELIQKEQELKMQYEQMVESLESSLVDKLTEVYEHVLGVRLQEEKDMVQYLLMRSMKMLDSGRNYIIHVSKEEYEDIRNNKQKLSEETGMPIESFEIISDGTLKTGDCMIESENGIMDCGLGTQLELLKRQLKMLSYEQ